MPSSINMSLANYLFNNKSSATDSLSTIYQNNISFLTRGQNGKLSLPTMAQFNAAQSPAEQVRIAYNLAKSAQVQTSALAQTGITTRAGDITKAAQQAMSALQTATNSVNMAAGADGLKACAATIGSSLTTLKESMVQLARSAKKMGSSDATSINNTLANMDKTAQSIAKTAGLKWASPFSSAKSTSTQSSSASSNSSRLVDFLA